MLKYTLRVKVKCPKNHRYNPATDGQEFRASCEGCNRMYEIWMTIQKVRRLAGQADDEVTK